MQQCIVCRDEKVGIECNCARCVKCIGGAIADHARAQLVITPG